MGRLMTQIVGSSGALSVRGSHESGRGLIFPCLAQIVEPICCDHFSNLAGTIFSRLISNNGSCFAHGLPIEELADGPGLDQEGDVLSTLGITFHLILFSFSFF